MFAFLRRFLDPLGPLGELISPSITFKTRQGLPIEAARSVYGQAPQTTADVAKTISGVARLLPADADVPTSRVRTISAFVDEVYSPIYEPCTSTNLADLMKAAQHPTLIGWRVTMRARKDAQAKAPMSAEQFVEHVQSLQIQASDEFYNQYLDFVKGNDPVIVDGQVLRGTPTFDSTGKMTHDGVIRGGTQIRHGRKEYEQKTKGYVHVDKGFWKERQKYLADEASRPVRNVKRALEAQRGISLPLWTPTGINPRRDRQADV